MMGECVVCSEQTPAAVGMVFIFGAVDPADGEEITRTRALSVHACLNHDADNLVKAHAQDLYDGEMVTTGIQAKAEHFSSFMAAAEWALTERDVLETACSLDRKW